jgi:hypothetical protein
MANLPSASIGHNNLHCLPEHPVLLRCWLDDDSQANDVIDLNARSRGLACLAFLVRPNQVTNADIRHY